MTLVQDGPPVHADSRGVAAQPQRQLLFDWVVKRGVLLVLVTAPLDSLFLGVLRITPPRMGYLYLLLASIALPAFVAWRRARSTDPDEPAQHFHRYALYSLVPVAMFSLVRIPRPVGPAVVAVRARPEHQHVGVLRLTPLDQ